MCGVAVRVTRVVPEKEALNGCVCLWVAVRAKFSRRIRVLAIVHNASACIDVCFDGKCCCDIERQPQQQIVEQRQYVVREERSSTQQQQQPQQPVVNSESVRVVSVMPQRTGSHGGFTSTAGESSMLQNGGLVSQSQQQRVYQTEQRTWTGGSQAAAVTGHLSSGQDHTLGGQQSLVGGRSLSVDTSTQHSMA